MTVAIVVSGQALAASASGRATSPAREATSVRPLSAALLAPSITRDRARRPAVRTPAGRPIARPADITRAASPAVAARGYLKRYGAKFHLSDPARQTRVGRVTTTGRGHHVVRTQQVAQGLPVIGGELVVTTDAANNLVSITGETAASAPRSFIPAVSAAQAAELALDRVGRAEDVSASSLRASAPELSVYDASLLGPGSSVARLVWRTEVGNGLDVRHYTLVDAQRGAVVLDFSMINEAKELHVCDRANVVDPAPDCADPADRSFVAATDSGALPPGDPGAVDVNAAFDNSFDFYDFLSTELGRDSLDDAGMALRSTVRYCDDGGCPMDNAFWNGSQMVYGAGFPLADDVVGHELAHGVTEFTSGLLYYYQSGAINESISDVFGELFDQQADRAGTDAPGKKWLLGEDLPVAAGEEPGSRVARNMANPPDFHQPDSMTSEKYQADVAFNDNGGVHTNSGVGNKAAFLMTDGGVHNGITVGAIGPDKALQVWYAAAKLLTSGSDYADLAVALVQGCNGLVGGPAGVTAADCIHVGNATTAVQMGVDPPNAATTPAPVCPTGMTKTAVWQDGFETATPADPTQLSWRVDEFAGAPTWGLADYYASEERQSVNAAEPDEASWSSLVPVTAPEGSTPRRFTVPSDGRHTFLRFDHSYDFEAFPGENFDGGKVEYSTDGVATVPLDAGSLIDTASHGYDGTIATGSGSPIAGELAFTSFSNGYTSTRVNLSSLAGKSVTPMFTAAFDAVGNAFPGWFIDNVEVYTCAIGQTSATISRSKSSITAGGFATISGRLVRAGTSTPVGSRTINLEQRKKGTSTWTRLTSRTSSPTGAVSATVKPTANTEYRWRFPGHSGWLASTSVARSVLVRPAITKSVNDSSIRLWSSFRVSGKVLPRMDRQSIKLQRYYRGGWHTVKGTTLTRYDAGRSKYVMTYRPPVRGTLRFRVYKPADAYHLSNIVTFTVRVR